MAEVNNHKRKAEEKENSEPSKHPSYNPRWNAELVKRMKSLNANEVLTQMRDGKAITVKSDDSLYTAMIVLCEDHITSVPVMDSSDAKKCVGFVDTFDVLSATIEVLADSPSWKSFTNTPKQKEDDDNNPLELLDDLMIQQISAKSVTDYSQKDKFEMVSLNDDLSKIGKELVGKDTQRVAVCDDQGSFLGIITQSGFVEYLNEEFVDLITDNEIKVKDINYTSKLVTIPLTMTAFEAFSKMKEEGVSVLGITNNVGVLIDVISAADLTLWNEWKTFGEKFRFTDFSVLHEPVKQYLDNSRSQREIAKRAPITCTKKSKLEDVISEMLYNNVHSTFILEDDRPVALLSYADIIKELIE